MDTNKVNVEIEFMMTNNILNYDELKFFNYSLEVMTRKITFNMATREDYMKFIEIELNTLYKCKDIIHEKESMYPNDDDIKYKNNEVLGILINRIKNIFKKMFRHYPISKISLTEYLDFWEKNKSFISDNKCVLKSSIMHQYNTPEIFILAATNELEVHCNIEGVRWYLTKGVLQHKDCKILYIEGFSMEIKYLEKTLGSSFPIHFYIVAKEKYDNLIKHFRGDMEMHFMLLDKAMTLLINDLQLMTIIIGDMVHEYSTNEQMWQKLAKINNKGFIYNHDSGKLCYKNDYFSIIKGCVHTFTVALKQNFHIKRKRYLWVKYIDQLLEFRESLCMENDKLRIFMDKTIERVFQEAHSFKALPGVDYYFIWADYTTEKRHDILIKAIDLIKSQVNFWIIMLERYIEYDPYKTEDKIFINCVTTLRDNSVVSLWEIINTYMHTTNPNLLEEYYNHNENDKTNNSTLTTQSQRLNWPRMQTDITAARKLLKELFTVNPKYRNLFADIDYYEKIVYKIKIINVRKLCSIACYMLGERDVRVWYDSMRFEYQFGHRSMANKLLTSSIIVLDPELRLRIAEDFKNLCRQYPEQSSINSINSSSSSNNSSRSKSSRSSNCSNCRYCTFSNCSKNRKGRLKKRF